MFFSLPEKRFSEDLFLWLVHRTCRNKSFHASAWKLLFLQVWLTANRWWTTIWFILNCNSYNYFSSMDVKVHTSTWLWHRRQTEKKMKIFRCLRTLWSMDKKEQMENRTETPCRNKQENMVTWFWTSCVYVEWKPSEHVSMERKHRRKIQ